MKQITLRLDKRQQRPVVLLKDTLSALLDTGAYLPVWVDDEAILTEHLGATLLRKNISIPDKESMIRNLKIKESNGKLHIMCQSASQTEYSIHCYKH